VDVVFTGMSTLPAEFSPRIYAEGSARWRARRSQRRGCGRLETDKSLAMESMGNRTASCTS